MFHQIAIDGVSGVGKTTISNLLAKKLNFLNINTGIFFRGIAYYKIHKNIESLDELMSGLKDLTFEQNKVLILNEDVTHLLFDQQINNNVPKISEIPKIRDFILKIEKECAKNNNIVIEGRDIGSVVFPNAILKIFLNARLSTRSARRYQQILNNDPNSSITLEEIQKTIEARDHADRSRKNSPLIKPADAIEIFTDDKSIDEIVNDIANNYYAKIQKLKQE